MRKLSVKEIIKFKHKSDISKKTFAATLTKEKVKGEGSGGHYWIICLSAIVKACRLNNTENIKDKIDEVRGKIKKSSHSRTKTQYQRNIDVMDGFVDFNFKKWIPAKITSFDKHNVFAVFPIKGVDIQASDQHVFAFLKEDANEIGAIWFVADLKGFKKEELGMYSEILFKYLKDRFGKKYEINSKHCVTVEVIHQTSVSFDQIERGVVSELLSPTLDEIKKLI